MARKQKQKLATFPTLHSTDQWIPNLCDPPQPSWDQEQLAATHQRASTHRLGNTVLSARLHTPPKINIFLNSCYHMFSHFTKLNETTKYIIKYQQKPSPISWRLHHVTFYTSSHQRKQLNLKPNPKSTKLGEQQTRLVIRCYTTGGSNTDCWLVKSAFQPVSIPQVITG
jgi:hypothetical protein